jgi:hypothetical protein
MDHNNLTHDSSLKMKRKFLFRGVGAFALAIAFPVYAQAPGQPPAPEAKSGEVVKTPENAQSDKAPTRTLCGAKDAATASQALEALPAAVKTLPAASKFKYLPTETVVQIALYREFKEAEFTYKVLIDAAWADPLRAVVEAVGLRTKASALLGAGEVWAAAATTGDGGTDFTGEKATKKTLVSFTPPASLGYFWRPAKVYVIGCANEAGDPAFVAPLSMRVTNNLVCAGLASAAALIFYVIIVYLTYRRRKRYQFNPPPMPGTKYLPLGRHFDPVVLTAGMNGRGSASKLQILFFSMIVFVLLAYVRMRTGFLSDLSATVLLLMGISGVGAAASAGTDKATGRLDFDIWAWLINRRWLPKGGIGEINAASWQDIITTDGEFDVFRFQMIIFSILVGISLLMTGLGDLASFTVPPALMGILGLSQVVYIGGKLVAPPSTADLNKQLNALKKAEADLKAAAAKATLAGRVTDIPTNLEEVRRRLGGKETDAYIEAAKTAQTMFQTIFRIKVAEANLAPQVPLPRPEIRILGWGSLLWGHHPEFDAQRDQWERQGPKLPLEFSRKSEGRALTLAIDRDNGVENEVSSARSRRATVAEAIEDLRLREGCNLDVIGFVDLASGQEPHGRDPATVKAVEAWAKENGCTAVVWTDLQSDFGGPWSVPAALDFIRSLPRERRAEAEKYINNVPASVHTRLREAIGRGELQNENNSG